jgi:hypothetical protein
LIAAGTSFSTAGLAAAVAGFVLGVEPEVELDELLLLLPHAAIAATQASEPAAPSQLLNERIGYSSFPRRRRQHKREIALRTTV